MKCEKSGNYTISYQSLLLSTTVLNDYRISYKFKSIVVFTCYGRRYYLRTNIISGQILVACI